MTDTTLILSRDMAASPSAVWRCLTEEDLLKQWFAPAPVKVTKAEIDASPGGIFHAVMDVPEMGEMDGGAGCVILAEPPARLIWTSALGPCFVPALPPGDGAFHFTAVITLDAIDTGTRYTATVLHADGAGRDAHAAMGFEDGWGAAADQLATLAATL
ncbi:MAG: SRPBCC domain-containing protein [Pseudomonadota bacterium]